MLLLGFLLYVVCVNAEDCGPKEFQDAQPCWYPYVVSLRKDNGHICGGAILDSTHILTAAHCVDSYKNDFTKLEVVTNTTFLDKGGEHHRVSRLFIREGYNVKTAKLDIAVIKLQDPIVENDYQRPIAYTRTKPRPDAYALLAGWGRIPETDSIQTFNKQQYIFLWMLESDKCEMYYPKDGICTSTTATHPLTRGFSGSPLVFNNEVIGVASRTFLKRRWPDYFASVYDNLSFIRNSLQL